jgi:hypothetical protein
MTVVVDDLLRLLPEVYRVRDAGQGKALAGLMAVIAEQATAVDADILQLYDDWFIETCQEWLTSYIGDLLRVRNLSPVTAGTSSQRAFVANTLRYRRAKGTVSVLELLAFDVTGWSARAVEFFQLLDTTQYAKHIRPRNYRTPDLRDTARLELLGSPFDTIAHTVEVRSPARGGRYNIPVVGISLWRLQSYPVIGVTPFKKHQATGFTFSPLGLDLRLFNPAPDAPPPDRLATEADVPEPLRRRPLYAAGRGAPPLVFFGADPVLRVFRKTGAAITEVAKQDIHICDLSQWTNPVSGVAVDPVLGRLVAADASWIPVAVDYAYGFSGDLGGGPYDRRAAVACWYDPKVRKVDWQARVRTAPPHGPADPYPDLASALAAWDTFQLANAPAFGVIAIEDSASYDLTGLASIRVPAGTRLVIIAAGVPDPTVMGELDATGVRPHLTGGVTVTGTAPAGADAPGELILHGLLIEGPVTAKPGNLGRLLIDHCTLVPKSTIDSVSVAGNPEVEVALCRSICGLITIADAAAMLSIADSIIDGVVSLEVPLPVLAVDADDTPARIDTTTILGTAETRSLTASNSLFFQPVTVHRRQSGCVRFCYVPDHSQTPRHFRCQPDLAISSRGAVPEQEVRNRLLPAFTAVDYGSAGYCQLHRSTAFELRTGAEDGSEFGAFSFLKQPQRERNLLAALDEYLRAGLTGGIFYET